MTFYHLVNFRTTPSELYTYEITSVNLSFPRHGLRHIKPNELGFFFFFFQSVKINGFYIYFIIFHRVLNHKILLPFIVV